MSERELGPFVVVTGTAPRRRLPRTGRQTVGDKDGRYPVGVWVSWLGRQVGVVRSRWWLRKATWRNQAACRLARPRPGSITFTPTRHRELRVVTRAGLVEDPHTGPRVDVLEDRIDCSRCGATLRGPGWVNR